jgi:LPXTG-site transpeptidase (sortase) family protein
MPKKRKSTKKPLKKQPQIQASSNVTIKQPSNHTKLFFILGSLFLVIFLTWHLNQTIQLMFFTPKITPVATTHPIPNHIIISKVNIDLPIEETTINHGVWQIADNGASHLTISANPGEKGPIILYGHNTTERFGPIRWLSIDDQIRITTTDKKIHTYKIIKKLTVSPDKLDVFTKNSGETLIIYTCDGFADLQRFVVLAVPVKN